jgi:hypothetical protein
MKMFARWQLLLLAIAAGTVPAGCAQSPTSGVSAMIPNAGITKSRIARYHSWMLPGTSQSDLMYVADTADNRVDVFTYPAGQPAGSLTGFQGLAYMCVDKKGNIFIPSYGLGKIFVYAHGATSPTRTLLDSRAIPYSCSVDPKTGDLAVANYLLSNSTAGNVVIYRHAKGPPFDEQPYGISNEYFCAYDDSGDLFILGGGQVGSASYFELEELKPGARLFGVVTLEKIPAYPNGLQWNSPYLALGTGTIAGPSTGDTYIYHVQISHFYGKTIGTTQLQEGGPTANFFIDGSTILVSGGESQPNVSLFAYPNGGAPTQTLSETSPYGVVVSPAQKGKRL